MSLRAIRPAFRAAASLRAVAPAARTWTFRPAVVAATRAFTSTPRRLGSGEVDSALAAAISSEINYEKEAADASPAVPEFLQSFQEHGVWEIKDTLGSDNVSLTRKFGNETLKVTFQVSDLEESSEGIEGAESEGEIEDFDQPPFISCSLLISKPATPQAMLVDLEAGDEGFIVTNLAMYEKDLAEDEGANGDWERRSRYMGPQFEHLDVDVQDAFNSYLTERGVDEALASFILQYCEYKEQRDYVTWLSEVKGFVEA